VDGGAARLRGRLGDGVPAAAARGLGSPEGHDLILALVVSVAVYTASLVLGPVQGAISSALPVRLTLPWQDRLIAAVSRPVGVAPSKNLDALNELELAHGKLSSYNPADAPPTLAVVAGNRLSGLLARAVPASYRWWLGAAMWALWVLVRRPPREGRGRPGPGVRRQGQPDTPGPLAPKQLAVQPGAATETRVFGLGDWLVQRFREQWTAGMTAAWLSLRRHNKGVTLGVVILAGDVAAPRSSPRAPGTTTSAWRRWRSSSRCWPRPRRWATSAGTTSPGSGSSTRGRAWNRGKPA
jgi:ATP-binding cassette, subfamily B, bacterial